MGRTAFLVIGLIVGFGLGVVGMQLGLDHYLGESTAPANLVQPTPVVSKYLLCHSELMQRDYPLVIRSDNGGATTMSFPGKTEGDDFRITEVTDTQYKAALNHPKYPEATTTIELNRVTGNMIKTLRVPHSAAQLLADICSKRVPLNECRSRIERIDADEWTACLSVANDLECPKWLAGSNIGSQFKYQCRATERTF